MPSLADKPPSPQTVALLMAGHEAEAAGKADEAIAAYEKARIADPRLAVGRSIAVLHDRAGRDDRALAEYQRAIEHPSVDAPLLNDFGYFHSQRGRWSEAEALFRQAIEKEPENRRAWNNLGVALAHQRRTEESLAAFRKAGSPAEAHTNLAAIAIKIGDRELAQTHLGRALEIDPVQRHALALLAVLEPLPLSVPSSLESIASRQLTP